MKRIAEWLTSIGQDRYLATFEQQRIDMDVLAEIGDDDLAGMDIPLGDRKRILRAIAALPREALASGDSVRDGPTVERRQVTALFVDIAGYTPLVNEMGAEAAHELVQAFYRCISSIVESHGGTIERYIGDAVMSVFGFPVARGNEGERAVTAALAIHQSMPQLALDVGRDIAVHVGIASGQVVASREGETAREFSTVGDTVNLGARLAGLAPAGGTVISDTVWQTTARLVRAHSLGEVQVKGFEHPQRAWQVLGWSDTRDTPPQAPLVGRAFELRQFEGLCEAARGSGSGQVIYVRGEAGIGKSRLLSEFEAIAARQGFDTHKALALDFGIGRGGDVSSQIVTSLLNVPPGANGDQRAQGLAHAVESELIGAAEHAAAQDLLGLEHDAQAHSLFDAMDNAQREQARRKCVVALVQRCSARQPLVIAVEDVHWAEAAVLSTLAACAALTRSHLLLLVLTSRREDDPIGASWRAEAGPALAMLTLDLAPLQPEDARTLAASVNLLANDALTAKCIARAEGNPLFLEQLIRGAQTGDATSVPDSIQSIVFARLDRLPVRERRAIQAASVLGQRFSLELLRSVLDDAQYVCDALIAEQLLRPLAGELLFYHALIRDSVYLSLLSEQRRAWHERAARWYAERDPILEAEHLDRAGNTLAARAYLRAAQSERRLYRADKALGLFERGLALAQASDRIELLIERGELLVDLGRVSEGSADFDAALAATEDDRPRVRAWIGLAAAMRATDRYTDAPALLDRAEQALDPREHPLEAAQLHYLRGNLQFYDSTGQMDRCKQEHRLALDYARAAASPEWEARALSGLGDAYFSAGEVTTALRLFEQCVALARKHGYGKIEVANLAMLGLLNPYVMQSAVRGIALCTEALELAQRVGQPRAEIIARQALASNFLEAGDLVRARETAETAWELARTIGAKRFEADSLMFLGFCLYLEQRSAEARAVFERSLDVAKDHMVYCGPCLLAGLAAVADDDAERDARLAEAEALLVPASLAFNHYYTYQIGIELMLAAREFGRAAHYAGRLEAAFAREPVPLIAFVTERARLLIEAASRGEEGLPAARIDALLQQGTAAGVTAMLPALQKLKEAIASRGSSATAAPA